MAAMDELRRRRRLRQWILSLLLLLAVVAASACGAAALTPSEAMATRSVGRSCASLHTQRLTWWWSSDRVRGMFVHAYDAYMAHAFPRDELAPLSCAGRNTWGGYVSSAGGGGGAPASP
jgi:hypothetical protein